VNEFVCGNKQILLGIILSMTLARHGVREIGLYDLGSIWGFWGLRRWDGKDEAEFVGLSDVEI